MTDGLAARFVAETSLPLVRQVAASIPQLRSVVIGHPDLEEDLWLSFYRGKKLPAVAEAKRLVDRPLTGAQIGHLIEVETRSQVLVTMVRANRLTTAQLDALTRAKGCTAPVVDALLDTQPDTLSRDWLRAAGLAAGGKVLLEYFCQASEQECPDEEMAEHLRRYGDWGPDWEQARMTTLIHRRPQLIGAALASGHPQFATVIAGSRLIGDVELQRQVAGLLDEEATDPPQSWLDAHAFTWMALAWNPVADLEVVKALDELLPRQQVKHDASYAATDRLRSKPAPVTVPFDEVTDPAQLSWLVQRTVRKPRPEDLEILARNPHLGPGEAGQLLSGVLAQPKLVDLAAPGTPAQQVLLDLAARFPEEAGEHFAEQLDREYARRNRDERPADDTEDRPERIERPAAAPVADGTLPVEALNWNLRARAALEQALADAPAAAWQFVLTKLDDFHGSIDDLAVVASAVGAAG